ncbi:MAG TPA: protein kinase [Chthoniobacterales bacterium]|jgi:serine/threonine protein kinase/Flp pilus assembly protein TadD
MTNKSQGTDEVVELDRLETIFHAACECEPDKVSSYLDTACGGDDLLRERVESLLRSSQWATDFIETPPAALATWAVKSDAINSPIGRTIGHYTVIELIGRGGMGEAYLAVDTKGGRKAVLKLLPAHFTASAARVRRFQQEARAVIALNHPNVVTIYEIGEEDSTYYIASELIEGETLRQRLGRGQVQLEEVIEIAAQVASALAAAHKAGVVHRDIKPENIMVRDDGYVKVLDFGIAKLTQPDVVEVLPNEHRIADAQTIFGSTIGTLRYMSPEQVRGEPVDERTDIWSLGVVLYEMAAGIAPFSGNTAEKISRAIGQTAPAALPAGSARLTPEFQHMILKALEKDRAHRYLNMSQMLESLKHLRRKVELEAQDFNKWRLPAALAGAALILAAAIFLLTHHKTDEAPAMRELKSIAVLPFESGNGKKAERYFVEGIGDELVNQLSRIAELKVISGSSTQRYQASNRNLDVIGQQLGVVYLVEGSLQKSGEQMQLEVQLNNVSTHSRLWAEKYLRSRDDIFAVESDIVSKVADNLHITLSQSNRKILAAPATRTAEAHELYLQGRYLSTRSDEQNLKRAIDCFQQAIDKDPNYALGYAGLAEVYIMLPDWGTETPTQHYYGLARTAAEKAVACDPTLPEAHIALALAVRHEDRDFARAEQELEHAIELSPSSATAHYYLGYVVYTPQGDFEHALPEIKCAAELDPLNAITQANYATCYLLARHYLEAIAQSQKSLELEPHCFPALNTLGMALLLNGRTDEGIETFKRAYGIGDCYHSLASLAYAYARKGDRVEALQALGQLENLENQGTRAWPLGHAMIHAALGNKDRAMQWLERGATKNDSTVTNNIKVLPMLDPLRGDARFERLLTELIPPPRKKSDSQAVAVLPSARETGAAFREHQPPTYGVNLLVNGGAEDGPASVIAASVPVPGWRTTGGFTVVPYGAPEGYPTVTEASLNGMKQFFTGGRDAVSTAIQEIAVSSNANDIDAGKVICDISAWLGGYFDQDDEATLTVEFRNDAASNLKSVVLGPVTALERAKQTGLKFRNSSVSVPAKTRRICVKLVLTRKPGAGSCNGGYADNLSVILHRAAGS